MVLLMYPVTQWRGMPFSKEDLPSFPIFLLHLTYFAIFEEFAFYYFHRLVIHFNDLVANYTRMCTSLRGF